MKKETKTPEIKTFLPVFNGFYGSYWEDYLTSEGEAEHYNFKPDFDFEQYIDYKKYFNELSRQFCHILSNELKEFVYNIEFEELRSPKEYNFTNDSINCTIKPNVSAIKSYILANKSKYAEYLKSKFTSCSGFISFYPNNFKGWVELTKNFTDFENPFYLGSVLDFIAENEGINEDVFIDGVIDIHISEFYNEEFNKLTQSIN